MIFSFIQIKWADPKDPPVNYFLVGDQMKPGKETPPVTFSISAAP